MFWAVVILAVSSIWMGNEIQNLKAEIGSQNHYIKKLKERFLDDLKD